MQEDTNNKIEELSSRIDEQSNLIKEQDEKILVLEEKPVSLDRYLDNQSKDIIEEIVSERILDVFSDKIIFFSSVFESTDRLLITGSVSTGPNGLVMDNTSASCAAFLGQEVNNPFVPTQNTVFETVVKFSDVSEAYFYTAMLYGTSTEGAYFRLINGVITGYCYDGSNSTEISLLTVTDATDYILQMRYYPGERIDFFINGTQKGTITSNLPPLTTNVDNHVVYGFEKNDIGSLDSTVSITYLSLLQQK